MRRLIDYPSYFAPETYDEVIDKMVERLAAETAVASVYQIGGVSSPGISDIDLLVIFKNSTQCHYNPLLNLPKLHRYFFVHHLYGLPEKYLPQVPRFSFFHNYTHIWGEVQGVLTSTASDENLARVNQQVGLEYLLKMHINLTIERTYGIHKVRGLLLHAKALLYDLDYLRISDGKLIGLVHRFLEWREDWFDHPPSVPDLRDWAEDFHETLEQTLHDLFHKFPFYMAPWANPVIAKNIALVRGDNFNYVHRGVTLPSIFSGLDRKYFNVQNRFNNFRFQLPLQTEGLPDLVKERAELIREMNAYNRSLLPNFVPVAYGMAIFNPRNDASDNS